MLYFFIGTTAELIKLLPVIRESRKRDVPFRIIASGQNRITEEHILLEMAGITKIDFILYDREIKKTALHLLGWFLRSIFRGIGKLRGEFKNAKKEKSSMIIHGDTVSTVLGAIIARYYGLKIAHVEAGLRSFRLSQPFPEEICRMIVSRFTHIHFCPNEWSVQNLKYRKGDKINTQQNTAFESLLLALEQPVKSSLLEKLENKPYYVCVFHRQENMHNQKLISFLVHDIILPTSAKVKCLFVTHAITKQMLKNNGYMEKLTRHPNVSMTERIAYLEFMHILKNCEYIITDGGSTQEEAYYLGKPCILLRHVTERIEGVGKNAVLGNNNFSTILNFVHHYQKYRTVPISPNVQPSNLILNYLTK